MKYMNIHGRIGLIASGTLFEKREAFDREETP